MVSPSTTQASSADEPHRRKLTEEATVLERVPRLGSDLNARPPALAPPASPTTTSQMIDSRRRAGALVPAAGRSSKGRTVPDVGPCLCAQGPEASTWAGALVRGERVREATFQTRLPMT